MQNVIPKLLRGESVTDADLANAGPIRPALIAMRGLYSAMRSDMKAYQQRTSAPDFASLLALTTLQNPAGVARSVATLRETNDLLNQAESRMNGEFDSLSHQVSQMELPDSMKLSFQNSADSGMTAARVQLAEFFHIEHDFLAAAGELLSFIRDKQGRFIVRGNDLHFARDADGGAYTQHVLKIQALASRENAWRQRQAAEVTKQIEDLRHLGDPSGP